MRLSRLVTTDDLGRYAREPAQRWGARHPAHAWLAEGTECPFCVGYWCGVVVLAAYQVRPLRPLWRFVCGTLTLNEVAAHLGARLGDTS